MPEPAATPSQPPPAWPAMLVRRTRRPTIGRLATSPATGSMGAGGKDDSCLISTLSMDGGWGRRLTPGHVRTGPTQGVEPHAASSRMLTTKWSADGLLLAVIPWIVHGWALHMLPVRRLVGGGGARRLPWMPLAMGPAATWRSSSSLCRVTFPIAQEDPETTIQGPTGPPLAAPGRTGRGASPLFLLDPSPMTKLGVAG